VERATLTGEDTESAKKTLAALGAEHASFKATLDRLVGRLNAEKAALDKVTELKAELEGTRKLIEQAQADADHGRVAELRYSVMPRLEEELKTQTAGLDNLHDEGRMVREEVLESDIATVVGDWTGIPANKMLEGERQKILAVGERLGQRVIGQAEAVEAIAGAVRRSRAGVQDKDRPIGSFFFVGPTGVGKTELAKALADFLFDSEDALIRIDMSEYMEQSKVNSLIGSARGYVDSDKGGMLTEAVRRRPYSVVLFDEAEKAHPDVFNILLQVLDEGRLTDSQGRRIDFTNTIVIMTSNVGARQILDLTGTVAYEELQGEVMNILEDHFKPEFLNRIDEKVVFGALDRDSIVKILEILIRSFNKILAEQELSITFTDAAKEHLVDVGYQPEYGARPLKRALLTEVQDPLATCILNGEFAPGDAIVADRDGDRLTFAKA
jgi:ATP-dependent Clp protease ATP-binding subunit ClpB